MLQNGRYRSPMTTTSVAGVPAELRGAIARAGLSQEDACDHAGLSRTTYYRRVADPGEWRLGELERLAAAAGCTLSISLVPLAPAQPCTTGTGGSA